MCDFYFFVCFLCFRFGSWNCTRRKYLMWSLTLDVSGCWPQHLWIRQSKSGTSETSKTKLIFFMCFLMINLSMQVSSWDKNFVTWMSAASPIHVFFFLSFFMSFGFYVAFLPKKHELILFLPLIFVFLRDENTLEQALIQPDANCSSII